MHKLLSLTFSVTFFIFDRCVVMHSAAYCQQRANHVVYRLLSLV